MSCNLLEKKWYKKWYKNGTVNFDLATLIRTKNDKIIQDEKRF